VLLPQLQHLGRIGQVPRAVLVPVYQEMARRDAEFYSQLEAAGSELDFGVDGSGLFLKYLRRGSRYYIDVGASQLVIDGRVKLKNG
jgi:putative flavoprotein involved in K+ transport